MKFNKKLVIAFVGVLLCGVIAPTVNVKTTKADEIDFSKKVENIEGYTITSEQTLDGKRLTVQNPTETKILDIKSDTIHVKILDGLGDVISEEDISLATTLPIQERTGSKTYELFNHKYWYQTDGNYIRIGCVAKYKVKNTNSHVKKYRTDINTCNSKLIKSGITGVSAAIGAGVLIGLGAVCPIATLVMAILAVLAVGATAAHLIVDAFLAYHDATDEYDMAKVSGTKY